MEKFTEGFYDRTVRLTPKEQRDKEQREFFEESYPALFAADCDFDVRFSVPERATDSTRSCSWFDGTPTDIW